ncbi:MAG: hypothetical protein QM709_04970 [Spongiibacteraceae bacterium]
MNPIKTFLTISALATVANAVSATTWDVTMNAQKYMAGVNGDLVFENFVGTWDDITEAGTWSGHTYSQTSSLTTSTGVVVPLDLNFTQSFSMSKAVKFVYDPSYGALPKQGQLFQFSISSCHDNITGLDGEYSSACAGFGQALTGDFFNTQGSALDVPVTFAPADGSTLTWTLQIYKAIWKTVAFLPITFNVTLHAQNAPSVPLPSTALLLGSGLVGLVGATRRRRAAK